MKNTVKVKNKPFSYDFHGNLPLDTDFTQIPNEQIHFYLDVDTTVGKEGCMQYCEHCWFVNYPNVFKKKFDTIVAYELYLFLKNKGYNVYPRYTDSFARDGEMFKVFGQARNKSFREGNNKLTNTMKRGECWTSGKVLLTDKAFKLLKLAEQNNYGTIIITFHGLLDENLNILENYPIKGVLHGRNFEKVVNVIEDYNKKENYSFNINVGITIGKHNNDDEMILRYIEYFNNKKFNIQVLRFNNFSAHNEKFRYLELTKEDRIKFFKKIKFIHDNIPLNYQLAVSEDFGTNGYEVMNYPENVGICKAGLQLFAIIPYDDIYYNKNGLKKIASIVGCVNVFEPILGDIYMNENEVDLNKKFILNFDLGAIRDLQQKRLNGFFKNGCYSQELRKYKYGD